MSERYFCVTRHASSYVDDSRPQVRFSQRVVRNRRASQPWLKTQKSAGLTTLRISGGGVIRSAKNADTVTSRGSCAAVGTSHLAGRCGRRTGAILVAGIERPGSQGDGCECLRARCPTSFIPEPMPGETKPGTSSGSVNRSTGWFSPSDRN
jgi:hypothetical protein